MVVVAVEVAVVVVGEVVGEVVGGVVGEGVGEGCGNTEGFAGASALMVTTALHDGQLPCMPSAEAGSCFWKEQ